MAEAGHNFLARLGKKRLRPGGKRATDWLMEQGAFTADKSVLEVACNMGTTTIELAQRFGCQITAVDMDSKALEKAQVNVEKAGVTDQVTLLRANAMKLPLEDESVDIIVNEAMLTMQADSAKRKCLEEYYRVLKPGGILLTHDVYLKTSDEAVRQQLSNAINVNVSPMTEAGWRGLAQKSGFSRVETLTGEMTLLSVRGLMYDEGLLNSLKITYRGLQKENRPLFLKMYKMFSKNADKLGFIAMASQKK